MNTGRHHITLPAVWVAIALLVLVAIPGCSASTGGQTTVPSVIGLPEAAAKTTLDGAGLVAQSTQEANTTVPTGTVLSQAPSAGAPAPKGTAVAIIVAGPATSPGVNPAPDAPVAPVVTPPKTSVTISVPRVVNQQSAAASAALRSVGLVVVTKRDSGSYAPAGQVVWQQPNPGTSVKTGATVTLYVSAGRPMVTVPTVVGLTSAAARSRLSRAGLDIGASYLQSRSVAKGRVMRQSIKPGTRVVKGKKVSMDISSGPPPVTVPNVAGMSTSAAGYSLRTAGFKVSQSNSYSNSVPKGIVIGQAPDAGTKQTPGTTVQINVSKGKTPTPMATVPDVVGDTLSAGSEHLRDLGFSVDVRYRDDPSVPEDQIIDQLPDAGTKVAKGSKVTIYVAQGYIPPDPPEPDPPQDGSGQ